MAENKIKARVQIASKTTAQWGTTTTIPKNGELIYDSTTKMMKIGNGSAAAKDLPNTSIRVSEKAIVSAGTVYTEETSFYDGAFIKSIGADRFDGGGPNGVKVERSTDGGVTWVDAGVTDTQKKQLFCSSIIVSTTIPVKNNSSDPDFSKYQLRITLSMVDFKLYCLLNKYAIYISTGGASNCRCRIRGRTFKNVAEGVDTWVQYADAQIKGWSGWNIINTGIHTFGGYSDSTDSAYCKELEFTFTQEGSNASYGGLSIGNIQAFGYISWVTPSAAAARGRLYTWDIDQNATFPQKLTASAIAKTGGKATQFLKADGSVDSTSYYHSSYVPETIVAYKRPTYSNRSRSLDVKTSDSTVKYFLSHNTTDTSDKMPKDGCVLSMSWDNSNTFCVQLGVSNSDGSVYTRYHNINQGSSWRPWIRQLNANDAVVSSVAYDATNKKIAAKNIQGTATEVVTAAKIVSDGGAVTSVKTVNGNSLVGSGNVSVGTVDTTGEMTSGHVVVSDGGSVIKDSGYTIGKSVPSDAVFTDTHHTSRTVVSENEDDTTSSTEAVSNPKIVHVENEEARSCYKLVGEGGTLVEWDGSSNITISSPSVSLSNGTISVDGSSIKPVTSVKLIQGTGITVSNSGTAITGSGERTISLNEATTGTIGGVKVAGVRSSAITTAQGSTTANRYYGVEKDSSGKAFVNVPWSDTDTHETNMIGTNAQPAMTTNVAITGNNTVSSQRDGVYLVGGDNITIEAVNATNGAGTIGFRISASEPQGGMVNITSNDGSVVVSQNGMQFDLSVGGAGGGDIDWNSVDWNAFWASGMNSFLDYLEGDGEAQERFRGILGI
ncbi:MAG: hypothetical protein IJV22_06160 [Bacteroidales bacterium]|nr:hypothetical protein [Bacteroidales bacterium]